MESEGKPPSLVTSALDGHVYSPSRSDNFITEETSLDPIGYATLYTIIVHFGLVTGMTVGVLREKVTE